MGGGREGATETILVPEVLLPGTWLPGTLWYFFWRWHSKFNQGGVYEGVVHTGLHPGILKELCIFFQNFNSAIIVHI